ncbi:NLRC3, partial [Symbiodinium sp. CCMP2456]
MFAKSLSSSKKCDLRHRGISDVGARVLAEELRHQDCLLSLDLRGNSITEVGVLDLCHAVAAHPGQLTEVLLTDKSPASRRLAGRLAATALAAAPHAAARAAAERGLGDEGMEELCPLLPNLGTLTTLGLQHNAIGARGACSLAEALPKMQALRELLLYSNDLGPQGAEAILKALPASVTALDLGSNRLGDEGGVFAADALMSTALVELHLDYNDLGPKTVDALLHSVKETPTLRSLWLHGNPVEE